MNFEERVIINEFHLNDTDDQVIQYIRHNKNQTVDNQMIVDSLFLYHRGCGQILVWKLGLVGVAIGTAISVVYRLLALVIYTSKHILHRPVLKFLKNFINSIFTIVISYVVINNFIGIQTFTFINWFIFAIKSVLIVLCIVIINVLVVDRKQLNVIKSLLIKRKKD